MKVPDLEQIIEDRRTGICRNCRQYFHQHDACIVWNVTYERLVTAYRCCPVNTIVLHDEFFEEF